MSIHPSRITLIRCHRTCAYTEARVKSYLAHRAAKQQTQQHIVQLRRVAVRHQHLPQRFESAQKKYQYSPRLRMRACWQVLVVDHSYVAIYIVDCIYKIKMQTHPELFLNLT